MSAREPKNQPMQRFGGIDDLLKIDDAIEVKGNINVEVNNDINVDGEVETDNKTNIDVDNDKLAQIKQKMSAKKKESNKQVTVYLTPENFKRFNRLKEKGAKSELINELLNAYFED